MLSNGTRIAFRHLSLANSFTHRVMGAFANASRLLFSDVTIIDTLCAFGAINATWPPELKAANLGEPDYAAVQVRGLVWAWYGGCIP